MPRELMEPDLEADVRYPLIDVILTGGSNNAGAIMGTVVNALRHHGVSYAEIDLYRKASLSGGYDNLLLTAMRWVNVS